MKEEEVEKDKTELEESVSSKKSAFKFSKLILPIILVIGLMTIGAFVFVKFQQMDSTLQQLQESLNKSQEALQQLQSQMTSLESTVNATAKEISVTKEEFVVKIAALRNVVQQQSQQISQLDSQIKDAQQKLGLQSQKLQEIEQKEELFKANIEKAKLSTVQLALIVWEDDGKLVEVQRYPFSCSGVVYKETASTLYVLTAQHCVYWRYNLYGLNEVDQWHQIDPNEPGGPEIIEELIAVAPLNGEFNKGTIVWIAPDLIDLAVVTLPRPSKGTYAVASLQSALPKSGDSVIAVGHPSGLEYSVTQGIVSAIRPYRFGGRTVDLIQTDTAVNPGNSGGGLFTLTDGKVIGIASFKLSQREGLSFYVSTKSFFELNPP